MSLYARATSGTSPRTVSTVARTVFVTSVHRTQTPVPTGRQVTAGVTVSSTSGTPSLVLTVVTTRTTVSVPAQEHVPVWILNIVHKVAVRIASIATTATSIPTSCVVVSTVIPPRVTATIVRRVRMSVVPRAGTTATSTRTTVASTAISTPGTQTTAVTPPIRPLRSVRTASVSTAPTVSSSV